jgi:hypothetical protein
MKWVRPGYPVVRMLWSHEDSASIPGGHKDSKEFAIVDLILLLSRVKGLGHEEDWVLPSR